MFRPYHKLKNCKNIEKWISNNQSSVTDDVLNGYNRYHYALIHKLKSAYIHLDNLITTLNDTDLALSESDTFLLKANLHLDSFFYCCGSAMDILGREILTYFSIPLPSDVYFKTARIKLNQSRRGDPLISKLGDPKWKHDFSNYRNALTHEVLLVMEFNIQVNLHGIEQQRTIRLPLPDNPRVNIPDRTSTRYRNSAEYCKKSFKRLLSLVNQIYGDIYQRARTGNSLPL